MRPSRRQRPPVTRRWTEGRFSITTLLVALWGAATAVEFVLPLLDPRGSSGWYINLLRLYGPDVAAGNYWQFASFMLVHLDPIHAVANGLILYFAGRELEPIVGRWKFLAIFLTGNLLGGLAHWLAMPQAGLTGVSAGVVAVLVAFTTTLPELEVTVHLFFVLPVRLRAKHLAIAVMAVCGAMWYAHSAPEIGPVAMLASCILGWLFARQLGFGNPMFFQRYVFERRQRAARLDRMSAEQFISTEIDPILEKISRLGMHSLTRAERRILDQGREKIAAKTAGK